MTKHHMRRKDRQVTDEEKIKGVIKKGKYISIAMSDEGNPYLVTLSYGYDENTNVMYFHAAKEGYKLDIIKNNSNVCATVVDDGGYIEGKCAHKYCSVVIRGSLHIVGSQDEKKHGLEMMIRHLEKEPDALLKKFMNNDSIYDKMVILRLNLEHISCKEGQ